MKTFYASAMAVMLVVFLAGCQAPSGPNQTSGAFLGGATGAVLGGVIGHNSGRHAATGAVIGSAIGALTGALVGKDIDESTRLRVTQGQPLTLEDIKALSRANVEDDLIISQINSTRTVYHLDVAQIIDLKEAGVSEKVIDYMINTPTALAQPKSVPVYDYHYAVPARYPYYYYFLPTYPHRFYRGRGHGHRRH